VSPLRAPSQFPLFPYAAFVLAGTVAGAQLGRQEMSVRRQRTLAWGAGLMAAGALIAWPLRSHVDFWGPSPAYVLLRLGGLLLLLRMVERATAMGPRLVRPLALLGHETLLVYVLHLLLLFGGVLGTGPLLGYVGRLGFGGAALVLALMLPVLLAAAYCWRWFKTRAPHEATLVLAFLGTVLVFELLTRPW
jgi:fucose 4-O-acetylase-like acetyltransferase